MLYQVKSCTGRVFTGFIVKIEYVVDSDRAGGGYYKVEMAEINLDCDVIFFTDNLANIKECE